MNKTLTTTVSIVIAVIVLLFAIKMIFPGLTGTEDKTINSVGSSEITAQPDQAEVYVRIQILRDTADMASTAAKEKSNLVIAALKAYTGATVETQSYNVGQKQEWTSEGMVSKGYEAIYSLKVTTKTFADVGKMIDSAINNGANGVDSVQFTLSKDQEEQVRKQALKQASDNAKQKATAVAEGLGAKLGDLVSVSEANYYSRPYFFAAAMEKVSAGQSVSDMVIEPSSVTVTASVSVIYSIK